MFEKIKNTAPKVPELVMDSLLKAMESGDIKMNEEIPPERELAVALGVGRGSLRESLAILEFLGIIESRFNRKVVVKPPDYIQKAIPFIRLSNNRDTMPDFIEFRVATEVAIVELACERATDEDIAVLEEIMSRFAQNPGDVSSDVEFHTQLAKASHNSIYAIVIDLINSMIQDMRARFFELPTYHQVTLQSHRDILEAVKKRDKALAKKEMVQHFYNINEFFYQQNKLPPEN